MSSAAHLEVLVAHGEPLGRARRPRPDSASTPASTLPRAEAGFPGPRRYRTLWSVGAAYWLAEWVLLWIRAWMAGAADGFTWVAAAAWATYDAASWALLCVAILALSTRFPAHRKALAPLAAGATLLAMARLVAAWALALPVVPVPAFYMLLQMPANVFVALGFLGAIQAIRFSEWQAHREGVAARLAAELAAAELRLVRMQLQPRSLFDALDSIATLMRRDVAAADRALAELGELLRASLDRTRRELAAGRGHDPASARGATPVFAPRGLGWYVRRFGPWYVAFWALFTLVEALSLIPMGYDAVLRRAVLIAGVWAPLGAPALLFAARFPIRRGHLAATVPGNLAVGCGTMLLYAAIRARFAAQPAGFPTQLAVDLPFALQVVGAAVGVGHLAFYIEQARRTEAGAYRLRAQLSEAELRMLQMQLHPHFLFNVLNSISALLHLDVAAADRMLRQVGRLLRLSLERAGREMVPLRDELEFVRLYLEIEQTRYQDRLRVRFEVAAAAPEVMVPHLILQPLVENAIRHGIAPHSEPAELLVVADVRRDGRLYLEVRDWGAGLRAEPPRRRGLGIPATRARLEQRYGSAATFEITSPAGGGTRVVVLIPPSADAERAPSPGLSGAAA